MKQSFKALMFSTFFAFVFITAFSQDEPTRIPKWYSEKGYWVVESNIHSPLEHIVRFYNNDNVLLYKETLTNTRLNPEKRSVKMKLKKVLESYGHF